MVLSTHSRYLQAVRIVVCTNVGRSSDVCCRPDSSAQFVPQSGRRLSRPVLPLLDHSPSIPLSGDTEDGQTASQLTEDMVVRKALEAMKGDRYLLVIERQEH
jgi:hypothetical protein